MGRGEEGTRVVTAGAGCADRDARMGLPGDPELCFARQETGGLVVRRHDVILLTPGLSLCSPCNYTDGFCREGGGNDSSRRVSVESKWEVASPGSHSRSS